ncbi:MAG TPA: hypothetical protein VFN48_02225 [Solirubrobacteraceae bacterium]|nr:hypothetical protein [Solirubrobacteraceae bacterium]
MTSIRALPLWVRYLVTVAVAGGLFALLVVFVNQHNGPLAEPPAGPNPAQAAQSLQQDRILVAQQQAPHRVRLAAADPRVAAAQAITRYMTRQVNLGFITGPIDGATRCGALAGSAAALRCRITSGPNSARLIYPFDVVVHAAARQVVFCQVVVSPDPSLPSPPISSVCR